MHWIVKWTLLMQLPNERCKSLQYLFPSTWFKVYLCSSCKQFWFRKRKWFKEYMSYLGLQTNSSFFMQYTTETNYLVFLWHEYILFYIYVLLDCSLIMCISYTLVWGDNLNSIHSSITVSYCLHVSLPFSPTYWFWLLEY